MGLESLKSPFIYCSLATREVLWSNFLSLLSTNVAVKLLLRLEKYPHRMNFAKGILESRKVHYKHLRSLLVQMNISSRCILLRAAKKALPLNTPTPLELSPNHFIRVTLFDVSDST